MYLLYTLLYLYQYWYRSTIFIPLLVYMKINSFLKHLLIFICIEIVFVFLIFREWPETNIFTVTGIGHLIYWVIVIGAWILREKTIHVWQKFLCTYVPIVAHLVLHIYIGAEILHAHGDGEVHHDEEVWLYIWVVVAGILIYLWETWLHRTNHCATHHQDAHTRCHDWECEWWCKN